MGLGRVATLVEGPNPQSAVAGLRCPHGVDVPDAHDPRAVVTRPSGTQVCAACGVRLEAESERKVRP